MPLKSLLPVVRAVAVTFLSLSSAMAGVVINEIKADSSERLLRYHENGAQSVGPDIPWWAPEFDDSDWQVGALPAGSGNNVQTDLSGLLRNRTFSLYTRMKFSASASAAASQALTLSANFNDGIIVWLNGVEVVRSNMGPPQGHFYADQEASRNGSSSTSSVEDFDISAFAAELVAGENVIAVQLANASLSGTMWIDFSLTAGAEEVIAAGSEASYRAGLTEPSGGVADFGALLDSDIEPGFSDWIELYNDGAASVDLSGWSLTDDASAPDKWLFPDGTQIAAGGYLLVLADNLPKVVPTADYLHANFTLSAGGEYLGLFDAAGAVQSAFDPDFPSQDAFHSYGRSGAAAGGLVFFEMPTPGKANGGTEYSGRVDAPDFDNQGGFYDGPVTVTLTSKTEGAKIRYTTDGTEPTETNGKDYTEPMVLEQVEDDAGHVIRARAFVAGRIASRIKTNTFLVQQKEELAGAPALIYAADVEKQLYDPYGVLAIQGGSYSDGNWVARDDNDYNYAMLRGRSYERMIHAEFYFPDGTAGFRTDCGVRIAASNWSRPRMTLTRPERSPWPADPNQKPSFNLYFRNEYGNPSVTLPFNGPTAPVNTFEKFRVRAGKNDIGIPFVTDEVVRRMYRDMGNVSTTGVFNSLYVNGELKNYYNMVERLRSPFFGDHHGQTPGASWDVLAYSNDENANVAEGDKTAWNDLEQLARGTITDENWEEIQKLADIKSIIDYYLVNIYMAMWDWPQNNWVAARERSDAGRYRFYVWDGEGAFNRGKPVSHNQIDTDLDSGAGELRRLWQGLRRWPQYRLAFADRVNKHFFNGGVLDDRDYENSHLKSIADDVTDEFAGLAFAVSRQRLSTAYIATWAREGTGRRAYLLGPKRDNFARNDLWPATPPPEFSQFGGSVPEGFGLRITNELGSVYYTTNGEDPRAVSGDPNPVAGSLAGSKLPVSLIARGSSWKYDDSGVDLGTAWRANAYDDSAWQQGGAPLGYGGITGTNIVTEVNPDRDLTTYVRGTFEVDDASAMLSLSASVHADAGCVVYINGQEALRDGFGSGEITFDTLPDTDGTEGEFDTFEIDPSLLITGTNVIAIAVKNQSVSGGSSDMVIDLGLEGMRTNPDNPAIPIDQPMTVKARSFNEGEWSALTEASFTVNTVPASSSNVAIAEILYNPVGPTDAEREAGITDGDQFEFIEIRNTGSQNVDLQGVRFTDGIAFDFSEGGIRSIAPGQHVILVSDLVAFQSRYGNGFDSMIAGQFIGNLNNGGEHVRLTCADDSALHEFTYEDSDPWPVEADDGYSLQIVDASGDHATAANWKASSSIGGNPGPEGGTPALTLAQWQATFFSDEELLNESFSGASADADGDLVSNFAEFVFGTSPRDRADSPPYPQGGVMQDADGNRYVTLTFTMSAERRAVTLSGEASADLTDWKNTAVERFGETAIADGKLKVTYRELTPVQAGQQRYLRLRMSAQ
ncbi:MAG: lamin tail domain-containing protein [Verrucomicrobiae bacterium]|nr:lamin tail domain-containing protein [Verrucomicrobiae bacterium]